MNKGTRKDLGNSRSSIIKNTLPQPKGWEARYTGTGTASWSLSIWTSNRSLGNTAQTIACSLSTPRTSSVTWTKRSTGEASVKQRVWPKFWTTSSRLSSKVPNNKNFSQLAMVSQSIGYRRVSFRPRRPSSTAKMQRRSKVNKEKSGARKASQLTCLCLSRWFRSSNLSMRSSSCSSRCHRKGCFKWQSTRNNSW